MQTTAARRAFSILSSKIHPQLPLTPREHQQLLNLLTTSFRQRLDREHPLNERDHSHNSHLQKLKGADIQPSPQPPSSQAVAIKHLDTILSNPLFAVRPTRRASDPLIVGDALQILRDPLSWFLEEIAVGKADIKKALICLDILEKNAPGNGASQTPQDRGPGTVIAEWIWSSGQENSLAFLGSRKLVELLVPQLVKEGKQNILWRWFQHRHKREAEEAIVDTSQIRYFRTRVLLNMVLAQIRSETSLDGAVATFLRAMRLLQDPLKSYISVLELAPAGIAIFERIVRPSYDSHSDLAPSSYDSFLQGMHFWVRGWQQLLPAILQVQHPSRPDAGPGLRYLRNWDTTRPIARKAQPFLTQLSLGVARQLLAEEKYADAQWVLEFVKTNFPELFTLDSSNDLERPEHQRTRHQDSEGTPTTRQNLDLLDRLSLSPA
ncbi:hypothetical protein GQ43DRAFT_377166 [Delitschia confertaspora ATCC 74209]|uniref:Uncharacterized protein n=1 Tax=Delitschia confertaspora ATCC 74209 TaxID=1513339 RepID=A0A9P4MN53_9PLEO|nr:hypothetical protein GQ43DRAFT_377166 [Delitschia confertaspora ATCC 74209]